MKNLKDVQTRLKNELDQWYIKQTRDIYRDYYLYYLETKPGRNGGFVICTEDPPNKEYELAGGKINKSATVQQNFNLLAPIVGRLPILSIY